MTHKKLKLLFLIAVLLYFISFYNNILNFTVVTIIPRNVANNDLSNITKSFYQLHTLLNQISSSEYDILEKQIANSLLSKSKEIVDCAIQHPTTARDCYEGKQVRSEYYMRKPYVLSDQVILYPDDNYNNLLFNSPNFCDDSPDIINGIHIGPQQFAYRIALRHTWGTIRNIEGYHIKTMFFMGVNYGNETEQKLLEMENNKYHDIVQFNYKNTYLNITIGIILSYNWTIYNCPRIKYFFKSDADLYINLNKIIKEEMVKIDEPPLKMTSIGRPIPHGKVIRNPYHKNSIFEELYEGKRYHPYLSGCFYVHPMDVLKVVVNASFTIHPLYIEDVYFGLVAAKRNITLKRMSRPINKLPNKWNKQFLRNRTAWHKAGPADLMAIFYYLHNSDSNDNPTISLINKNLK